MNYPTQPERLTTNDDYLAFQKPMATAMTWTDETPTEEGLYLFIGALYLSETLHPLSWAKMIHIEEIGTLGLCVMLDGVCIPVTSLHGKWLRIKYDE